MSIIKKLFIAAVFGSGIAGMFMVIGRSPVYGIVAGIVCFVVILPCDLGDDSGSGGSWEKTGELYTHDIRKYDIYERKDD